MDKGRFLFSFFTRPPELVMTTSPPLIFLSSLSSLRRQSTQNAVLSRRLERHRAGIHHNAITSALLLLPLGDGGSSIVLGGYASRGVILDMSPRPKEDFECCAFLLLLVAPPPPPPTAPARPSSRGGFRSPSPDGGFSFPSSSQRSDTPELHAPGVRQTAGRAKRNVAFAPDSPPAAPRKFTP